MEDWNEASEIRHLLKDVLPGHWKKRVEDEEKKSAKKRVAVRIMASVDTHAGMMEFFWRNLGEPSRVFGFKNADYVEVFGDTMRQRLTRLNNEAEPQDLSSSGVPTSGRSGRGHEEVVCRVY